MELTELELTGYIVVAWRSVDPIDKNMIVLYFETGQDLDAWIETGNTVYKTTPVTRLLPATDNATIWRKPDLAESTDFRLNVAPMLLPFKEAVPLYNEAQTLVGWKIQRRYE